MPDIHTIRLRHPWTCQLQGERAVWSRGFNWPAGLTPRETVYLVIEPLPSTANVLLNGQLLDAGAEPGRFDVTGLIAEYNQLEITLADTTGAADNRCPLEVRLEIDEG